MRAFSRGRKMPLPNILEFIGTNITQRKFQEAQEKLLNYLGIEVPTKTELNSEILKLNNAITPKANKVDVDTALSNLSTTANKYYSTLAAANADIANIALNQSVTIGEEANSGLWEKKTTGATSLTKSPYDLLTQARADATTKANAVKEYVDAQGVTVDVSKLSNNYSLSLTDAIALIPSDFRKTGAVVKFNGTKQFQYKGTYTIAKFADIRYWFNLEGLAKRGATNLLTNGVIHEGFVIQNGLTAYYHPENKVLISEIDRDYVGGLISLDSFTPLGINSLNWLDENFVTVAAVTGYGIGTPPANAKYYALNIAYNNGTSLISNEAVLKQASLPRNGYENLPLLQQTTQKQFQNYAGGLVEYTDGYGTKFLKPENDIFINEQTTIIVSPAKKLSIYLSELINSVEIIFKTSEALNRETGKLRRAFLSYVSLSGAVGGFTVRVSVERSTKAGVFVEYALPTERVSNNTLADSDILYKENSDSVGDPHIIVGLNYKRAKNVAAYTNILTLEQAEIKPQYLKNKFDSQFKEKTCKITNFDNYEVAFSSNYTYVPPESKMSRRIMYNGKKTFEQIGDSGKRHQQSGLFGEVKTHFLKDAKTLNIFASVEVDSNYTLPELTTFQVEMGTYATLGNQYSQYIHPDIAFSNTSIGGFSYHMINSMYPYSNPSFEDSEIFVSNDALNWQRVPSSDEVYTGSLSIRMPPTYWDVGDDRKILFMPIPKVGAVMQFATDTADVNNTVTQILNHDPFCLYLNGYIYYYCIYNLGLTGSTTTNHRYTFCYRTNDYVNWEVVREDGTWYPYNQANAALMFSKTNGVRNHMRYRNSVSANEAAPQVVRVSDTEYYYYVVDLTDKVHRYRGTSPTQFDFSTKETIVFDAPTVDRVWHCAVEYIDGKFYLIYGGRLCESLDGVNFNVPVAPFFWVGMSADLYKPSFTVASDGKIKLAYSLQPWLVTDYSFGNTVLNSQTIPTTVCCEFQSIAHIKTMGEQYRKDAFIDVAISVSNEKTRRNKLYRFFGIKSTKKIKDVLNFDTGDLVSVTVYLNTRSNGVARFNGLVIDNRI